MKNEATQTQIFQLGEFRFDSGDTLPQTQLAYESYGQLNEQKDNVLLLNHALTGNQHAYGYCEKLPDSLPEANKLWLTENHEGWWNRMIGPGRPLDTNKYHIICVNYLGSCYGSTGPTSIAPDGQPWGARFPMVTAHDQVRAQMQLLDSLGIERVRIIGASVGGFPAIVCSILYPERVAGLILIGISYKVGIDHHLSLFEQTLAIELDDKFCAGNYSSDDPPQRGLALARIICHKLFINQKQLDKRAKKGLIKQGDMLHWYQARRNKESYMLHQGSKFAKRFDANAYLRIIHMWCNFDLCQETGLNNIQACFDVIARHHIPILLFSISSDILASPRELSAYHRRLLRAGVQADYHCVPSDKGHDSFLLEPELYEKPIRQFLER